MNGPRFDRIARLFARRRSDQIAAANALVITPEAEEPTPGANTSYLFVQSFEGGTIAPKEGEVGTFTLTLRHGLGQTVYFADRPSRDVGALPTPKFLAGLGFPDDDPPNAALVVDDGNGGTDIAVLELRNPVFDADGPGVTYEVTVLDEWESSLELGFSESPADLGTLIPSFGNAHLFIDACQGALGGLFCVPCGDGDPCDQASGEFRTLRSHFCWHAPSGRCFPCEGLDLSRIPDTLDAVQWVAGYWANRCNQTYPDFCNGTCIPSWSNWSPV